MWITVKTSLRLVQKIKLKTFIILISITCITQNCGENDSFKSLIQNALIIISSTISVTICQVIS